MTEFKKHVESNAGSIYEQIETAKIDEKQQREEEAKKLKQQKSIVQAAFYSIIKEFFEGLDSKVPKKLQKESVLKDLKRIKKCFQTLMEEDKSQDVNFLSHLANVWLKFIDDYYVIKIHNKEFFQKIHSFVNEVSHFPEGAEYSLGYYLSEFAGFKWIPFPYMEILKNLHEQYVDDSEGSILKKWSLLIENIAKEA